MPTGKQVALIELTDSMIAQQRIQRGDYDYTAYEQVYQLYMLAYDDEELALDAEMRSAEAYAEEEMAKG